MNQITTDRDNILETLRQNRLMIGNTDDLEREKKVLAEQKNVDADDAGDGGNHHEGHSETGAETFHPRGGRTARTASLTSTKPSWAAWLTM